VLRGGMSSRGWASEASDGRLRAELGVAVGTEIQTAAWAEAVVLLGCQTQHFTLGCRRLPRLSRRCSSPASDFGSRPGLTCGQLGAGLSHCQWFGPLPNTPCLVCAPALPAWPGVRRCQNGSRCDQLRSCCVGRQVVSSLPEEPAPIGFLALGLLRAGARRRW